MEFIGDISAPTLLEIIAILFLLYWLLYRPAKLKVKWFLNNFGAEARAKKILNPVANDYAVITGGTSGIGLEYARQLAEKGFNLLLLSRSESKLQRVAGEIQEKCPQCKKVEILAVDFCRTDIYDEIQGKLISLDGPVRVLVNNVGIAFPGTKLFADYPDAFYHDLINVNIVSLTIMSKICLRLWTESKGGTSKEDIKKKPSKNLIINISSFAGITEMPTMSLYSSSKAYVNFLSKILSVQYEPEVIIQTVTPNYVLTNMIEHMDAKNLSCAVQASDYVRTALKTVASEQQTSGHLKHKLKNNFYLLLWSLMGERLAMKMKSAGLKEAEKKEVEEQKQQKVFDIPKIVTTTAEENENNNKK